MKATLENTKYSKEYSKVIGLLNKERYIPYLIDYIIYIIDIDTETLDYKSLHCLGCILPFRTFLMSLMITEKSDIIVPIKWWEKINQTKISSLYKNLFLSTSYADFKNYQKLLNIPESLFEDNLLFYQKLDIIFSEEKLNLSSTLFEEYTSIIRNNNRIAALFYLLQYLGYSLNNIQEVLSIINICLIQKCTR